MIRFRFDRHELLREVVQASIRGTTTPFTEPHPDFWLSDTTDYRDSLKNLYVHQQPNAEPSYNVYRIATGASGVTLFRDYCSIQSSGLSLTHPKRREGFLFNKRPHKLTSPLISLMNNGNVHYYSRFRHVVSLHNIHAFHLSRSTGRELIPKLATINSVHEWLEPHLVDVGNAENHALRQLMQAATVPVTAFRQMSSGQKMLTLLNQSDQVIQYRHVQDWSIDKLMVLLNWCADITNGDTLRTWMHGRACYGYLTEWSLIVDTLAMGRQLGERLHFPDSGNIPRWHDRTLERYLSKLDQIGNKPLKVSPAFDGATKALAGMGFALINDEGRLKMESQIMRHCVGTYAGNINSGHCAIYSGLYDGERFTLELRTLTHTYRINQMAGKANKSAPQPLHEKIIQQLHGIVPKDTPVVHASYSEWDAPF